LRACWQSFQQKKKALSSGALTIIKHGCVYNLLQSLFTTKIKEKYILPVLDYGHEDATKL
jgi:hypothetical protein